ncbi:MAG: hypothetical protein AB7I41_03495 [Candidatus Sericytochromatia bacterium]
MNNQEIRHAMSKPKERLFLNVCAHLSVMQELMSSSSKRMTNQELALRFFSFYLLDYEQTKKNLAHFLDAGLAELSRKTKSEQEELVQLFSEALCTAKEIFGDRAFEKQITEDTNKRRKNSSLFEVWTVTLAECTLEEREYLIQHRELLKAGFNRLLSEKQNDIDSNTFFDAISYHTQKSENVRLRYAKINQLIKEVLNA